jgi:hypothetical protein
LIVVNSAASDDADAGIDFRAFEELLTDVMRDADRFGHREHVHLTWLAVRRYGPSSAATVVGSGIQRTARYAGVPQKYNETVSRAWVAMIAHHVAQDPSDDFAAFAHRNAALLDKRLIARHYHPATLATPAAKDGWVEPDRAPFPWQRGVPTAD